MTVEPAAVVTEPTSPVVKPDDTVTPPKTYTQDEVDARFRGQGKELERLKETNAKFAADAQKRADDDKAKSDAKKIEAGEAADVLKGTKADLSARDATIKEMQTKIDASEAAEKERREAVEKANKKRLKALPDKYHDWPLPEDPEQASLAIGRLEAEATDTSPRSQRTRTSPPNQEGGTAAARIEAKLKAQSDRFMGVR